MYKDPMTTTVHWVCALSAFISIQAYIANPGEVHADELKLVSRPRVPTLVGPDTVEPSPVLVVSNEQTKLDGRPVTLDELGDELRTIVSNYRFLQPKVPYKGRILVACAPETSVQRLSQHLRLALATGHPNPMFLLIQPNPAAKNDRSADRITGALATLKKDDAADSLKVLEHENCLSLVSAVIRERNEGKAVFLDLGPEKVRGSSTAAAQHGVAPGGRPKTAARR
jgi:hypothetical protein